MEAPATPAPTVASPSRNRLTTLLVMGVTAVIIAVVAFMVNQPQTNAGDVTGVTLTGTPTGPAPEVGKPAPDFTAKTIDGKTVKLSDFKGQPVWLTFGASWCQPCRAENPDVKATADAYKADGLQVLAVFISEDAAAVKDYADRVGLDYLKVADPRTDISSQYRILGIPSHFFIDRDGVLRQMRIGGMDPAAMATAVQAIR